ncbi:MAG: aminodeoxychorismate/anthranilate synthase component II [Planctomycetes bacterium]|jgi:anthranilate synthase/aminodeoxychorismate synthase-like glutamine amidotransferase|nr:aminodeoxychorismate/anthranilate synthase component II [Planctomycetota bacterium]
MIFLLDNRDSFTFNLEHALRALGAEVEVQRSTEIDLDGVLERGPRGVLVGPGPGEPADGGCSEAVVREMPRHCPVLGICLGMQAMATAFGGHLAPARELVHGRTRPLVHDGRGIFEGLPSPLELACYNSLVVAHDDLPKVLEISATGTGEEIGALRHRTLPLEGLQVHPESILCLEAGGRDILRNFLISTGEIEAHDRISTAPQTEA